MSNMSNRAVLAASVFTAALALGSVPGLDGGFEIGGQAAYAQGQGVGAGRGGGVGHGRGGQGAGASNAGEAAASSAGGFGRGGPESDAAGRGPGLGRAGDPDGGFAGVFGGDSVDAHDEPFGRLDHTRRDRALGLDGTPASQGAVASELEGYNALHADPRARDMAAPNSMVVEAHDELDGLTARELETEFGFSEEAVRELRELLRARD